MSDVLGPGWLSESDIHGMYDSPGFLKPWYFNLRLFEEVTRSRRYERPVTLLTIVANGDAHLELAEWLTTRLRATDLLCKDALGRFFLLLPETADENAAELTSRLLGAFNSASVQKATIPGDPDRFAELADWITPDGAGRAA